MAIAALLPALLPILDRVLDVLPNQGARDQAKAEIALKMLELESSQNIAQLELNKQEASHSSLFVAGWRPFVGWVCGFALTWSFLLQPILNWIYVLNGYEVDFPELDLEPLMTLLFAMLGVGAMRSFDKVKGVDTKKVPLVKPKQKPLKYN